MRNRLLPLLALLVGLSPAACGGNPDPGDARMDAGVVVVQVDNSLTPSTTVTVSAVPDVGTARSLGSVLPGSAETFTYQPIGNSISFQLAARPTGAGSGQIVSRPLNVAEVGGTVVSWDLATNSITFGR